MYGSNNLPAGTWEIFVGTGLMSDRTMDFLYAGPAPVRMEPGGSIGGGDAHDGTPAFLDILLPEAADQLAILSNYDVTMNRQAVVPMVGGGHDR